MLSSRSLSPPKARPDRIYVYLGNLIFALVLIGYPMSASISQLLGVTGGEINILYRAFTVLLASIMIIWTFLKKRFSHDLLLIIFIALYLIRIFYEFSYPSFRSINRDLQIFLSIVLIPVIAMACARKWWNEDLALRMITFIGGLGGVLVAITISVESAVVVNSDPNLRGSFELLNPISVGYHGLYIGAAALILLIRKRDFFAICIAAPTLIVGTYLLIAGGSRGPVVALLFAMVVAGSASTKAKLVYVVGSALVICLFAIFGVPEVLFNRFATAGADASSLERIYIFDAALSLAVENPLFGYSYLEPFSSTHPHNMLVEAGMAIGVVGAALMLWMQASLLFQSRQASRRGEYLLSFIAATMLANAWISGSILSGGAFFVVLAVLRLLRPSISEVEWSNFIPSVNTNNKQA